MANTRKSLIGHKQVAAMIGISPNTLYEWVVLNRDMPTHYLINRRRRYDPDEVQAWINSHRV